MTVTRNLAAHLLLQAAGGWNENEMSPEKFKALQCGEQPARILFAKAWERLTAERDRVDRELIDLVDAALTLANVKEAIDGA